MLITHSCCNHSKSSQIERERKFLPIFLPRHMYARTHTKKTISQKESACAESGETVKRMENQVEICEKCRETTSFNRQLKWSLKTARMWQCGCDFFQAVAVAVVIANCWLPFCHALALKRTQAHDGTYTWQNPIISHRHSDTRPVSVSFHFARSLAHSQKIRRRSSSVFAEQRK